MRSSSVVSGEMVINSPGPGDDTLLGGTGHDTILGFTAVGSEDALDLTALGIAFEDLVVTQVGADTLVTLPSGDSVLLVGVAPGDLDAGSDFLF